MLSREKFAAPLCDETREDPRAYIIEMGYFLGTIPDPSLIVRN